MPSDSNDTFFMPHDFELSRQVHWWYRFIRPCIIILIIPLFFCLLFFSLSSLTLQIMSPVSDYTIWRHGEWRLAHQAWPLVHGTSHPKILFASLLDGGEFEGQAGLSYKSQDHDLLSWATCFGRYFPTVFHIRGRI